MNVFGSVIVRTKLTLQDLALIVSSHICGGIEFGRREDDFGIREEVPAVSLSKPFLGIGVVIYGGDGEFGIDVEQWDDQLLQSNAKELDVSADLVTLLSRIDGISAEVAGE